MKKGFVLILAVLLGMSTVTWAQDISDVDLGEFTDQASYTDNNTFPEDQKYDAATQTYEISGGGNDIWNNSDGFYFVYKKVTGDFIASADVAWVGEPGAGNEWKKMGIMAREDVTDAGSRHAISMLRRDLGSDLQFRNAAGGASGENPGLQPKKSDETDTIYLMRKGDSFTMFRGLTNGGLRQIGTTAFPDTVPADLYVGLFVTAHDASAIETGIFKNVKIAPLQTSLTATRKIPNLAINPGSKVSGITVDVEVEAGKTGNVTVVETPPAGWNISNVKASAGTATAANGKIAWTANNASGKITLTYDVDTPANAQVGIFSAVASIGDAQFPVAGDTTISRRLKTNVTNPTPVQMVNGEAFIQAEDAYQKKSPADVADPFEIALDSKASGGAAVNSLWENGARAINDNEMDFVFNVAQAGTYKVIASVLTPSGSDDSWYVGMDDDLFNIDADYRFQGTTHMGSNPTDRYTQMWVRTDGIEDLSWDLQPGVHTFRMHARENGSVVDWVLITNKLTQDPAAFQPPAPTSVVEFMLY